jgi:hypothetical protein
MGWDGMGWQIHVSKINVLEMNIGNFATSEMPCGEFGRQKAVSWH